MDSLRSRPRRRTTRWLTPVISGLALTMLISPVVAAVDDGTIDAVVDDVMFTFDVDDPGQSLREQLREQLRVALQRGVVDEADIDALGYGTVESVTPSTERDRDMIRERLLDRLRDQIDRWEIIAPEWRQTMEQLRERLRTCLDEPTETCLEQNRLEMQYRHAERVEAEIENRLAAANGDVDTLAELERQRERAQLRLETMLQNGDAETLNGVGVQTKDMEQLRTRLEEHTQTTTRSTTQSTTQSTTMSSVASSSTVQERKGQP